MADYQSPGFAQGEETNSKNVYDFWNQVYTKFNPPAPTVQPTDMSGTESRLLAGQAAPGSLDTNRFMSNLYDKTAAKDELGNFRSLMGNELGGLDRMDYLSNLGRRMNYDLPLSREEAYVGTGDTEKSMWDQYKNTQPDIFESALGGFAGGVGKGASRGSSGYGSMGLPGSQAGPVIGLDQYGMPLNTSFAGG